MRTYQSTPTPSRMSFSFPVQKVRKLLELCELHAADAETEGLRAMFAARLMSHELAPTVPSEEE